MYKPKFPKPIRKKKSKRVKKAKAPESHLQAQVNSMLKWANISYIRVPDLIYRLQGWDQRLRPHEKKVLKDAFKSLPDNIIMMPLDQNYFLGLNLELKSDTGKLSQGQKAYARNMPVTVCRDLEGVQKAIKDLMGAVDHFNTNMALNGPARE